MADFCKKCSILLFGEDYRDLAGLVDPVEVDLGVGAVALCENCGLILVDDEGNAVVHANEE